MENHPPSSIFNLPSSILAILGGLIETLLQDLRYGIRTLVKNPGLVVGLPAAYGLGRWFESMLFGVKASDPLVFVAAGVLLTGATLLGGYLPARKAASIDPLVALRCE